MKWIDYRGGIARFQLPAFWTEEYEQEGGATFFEDKPDSGTLRVNAIAVEKSSGENDPTPTASALIAEVSDGTEVKNLPSGAAVAHAISRAVEDEKRIVLHTWHVGVRVTSTHFRVIMFTYTILAAQESDPGVRQDIAMLDQSILQGEYAAGKGVPGKYVQNESEHSRTE